MGQVSREIIIHGWCPQHIETRGNVAHSYLRDDQISPHYSTHLIFECSIQMAPSALLPKVGHCLCGPAFKVSTLHSLSHFGVQVLNNVKCPNCCVFEIWDWTFLFFSFIPRNGDEEIISSHPHRDIIFP